MPINRRTILTGLAAVAGSSLSVPLARRSVAQTTSTDVLSVVLTFQNGSTLHFNQQSAHDLGDYVGQFVQQKCFVERQDVWTVFFRPDADGSRDEIVVERGRIWLSNGQSATNSPGYTAQILKNGVLIATVSVPVHWWAARWRWSSAPRPVVRSASDIMAGTYVPPFATSGLYGAPALSGTDTSFTGPMSYGPIDPNMPDTGERNDIGIIPEPHALYLVYNADPSDEAALSNVTSWGEGAATIPIHFRDEHTNSTLNWYTYPNAAQDGSPVVPWAPDGTNDPAAAGHWVDYNAAHAPAPAYIPYLLTDDPYYLEEMEATAAATILFTDYHRANYGLPGLTYPGETRSWAWGIRSIFQVALVAPTTPPKWLRPAWFWRRTLADNLSFAKKYMSSTNISQTVFRAIPGIVSADVWQQNMILLVSSWAAWTGAFQTGWKSFVNWEIEMQIKMTNGISGWDRRWPIPYVFYFVPQMLGDTVCCVLDGQYNSTMPTTWAEMFKTSLQEMTSYFQQTYPNSFNPATLDPATWNNEIQCWNPSLGVPPAYSSADYALMLRGALAMAIRAGITRAQSSYNYIADNMPGILNSYNEQGMARWAVSPS